MHNLDTTNGQTSFISAREDAWHQLGTVVDDTFDAETAMRQGLLGGWDVRKAPVVATLETGEMLDMPGRYATVRTNPVNGQAEVLGNVGELYQVIQNEEHAELLNALVDEGGAHFETAGAIDGGRKVFITMKLPGHMRVGGVDRVDNYIAAVNSHDGSTAFTLMVTPVRIVCQNTLNVALREARNSFRIRHTANASSQIHSQARQALDLTFGYLEGFQEQAERMINTALTQAEFDKIITEAWGPSSSAAANTVTRRENQLDQMSGLFTAQTQEKVAGTVWAGFNALTEWADHFSPTRGDERDASRAVKSVLDPRFKNEALELMLARV